MTEGKKKVLVIGAAGSIGTHLLAELIRRDYTPVAALHRRCLHSHTHSLTHLLAHPRIYSLIHVLIQLSMLLRCALI
jgi:FlaA1/EpsC-like NDP-sugar epimerase